MDLQSKRPAQDGGEFHVGDQLMRGPGIKEPGVPQPQVGDRGTQ